MHVHFQIVKFIQIYIYISISEKKKFQNSITKLLRSMIQANDQKTKEEK